MRSILFFLSRGVEGIYNSTVCCTLGWSMRIVILSITTFVIECGNLSCNDKRRASEDTWWNLEFYCMQNTRMDYEELWFLNHDTSIERGNLTYNGKRQASEDTCSDTQRITLYRYTPSHTCTDERSLLAVRLNQETSVDGLRSHRLKAFNGSVTDDSYAFSARAKHVA